MGTQVTTAANSDPFLFELQNKVLGELWEKETPGLQMFNAGVKKTTVNQKGNSKTVETDAIIQHKAGLSSMNYPGGMKVNGTRYHVVPTFRATSHEIDHSTMRDYKRGDANTLHSVARHMRLLTQAFAHEEEFYLWGDKSGKLGVLAAGSTTTVLNLDTVPNGTHAKAFGVYHLFETPAEYDLYTSANVFVASFSITAKDVVNNQVTITPALGGAPAAGGYIVRKDSWFQQAAGMAYLIAGGRTGLFQNTNVTGDPRHNAMAMDLQGFDVNNMFIEKTLQKLGFRSGMPGREKRKNLRICTSPAQETIYLSPGWGMVERTMSERTYDTSIDDARYGDSLIEKFNHCDPDRWYFEDLSTFERIEQEAPGILGEDGLQWRQKQGSGTGSGVYYLNYGCNDNRQVNEPQKNAIMYNASVDGAVTPGNFYNAS